MARTCPVDLDQNRLKSEIASLYDHVSREPDGDFHFHRGPDYAVKILGYDPAALASLPAESTESFAGVGNPHQIDPISPGDDVLDIGCGSGMDLLLAAGRVAPSGSAIGVDMTSTMADKARTAAERAGLTNVEVRLGDAEDLPVDDHSVDVVISNGVLNLAPDKERAFAEIRRVLRPGGRLQIADIVVQEELSPELRSDIDLWTG